MTDVLIVGAGPTGLALALWLTKQGVAVRIVDRAPGPGASSRAVIVHARTLELYRQVGLAEAVVRGGQINPCINMWAGGTHRVRIRFGEAGANITPYPFLLVYPQDEHERLLITKLEELGVVVERNTELVSFDSKVDGVAARLRTAGGLEQTCEARYLAGCDGARSSVRHLLGAQFGGGSYRQLFYVADVEVSQLEPENEAHFALDEADFVAVFSYGNGSRCRLIGTVADERAERSSTLRFKDVSHDAIDRLGLRVDKVNWFSTYRVHHRVTDRFRHGRVFLLGDAAHVHSPAGGQGMNTGIADAVNLAWKLAAVLHGQAPDSLLDSYEAERQAFARKLVKTTDRVFTMATAEGAVASFVRSRVVPSLLRMVYSSERAQTYLFRTISQTSLDYRASPLSHGQAGSAHGGDRLPWASSAGANNYEALRDLGWQMHIYGAAQADLRAWCEQQNVQLHVYTWSPEHERAGLARDAAYLLRPDTYVACADSTQDSTALTRYLEAQGFQFNSRQSAT